MKLTELIEQYKDCTDTQRAYVLLSMIIDEATEQKEVIKPELESGEIGSVVFNELGKSLDLIEMQKSTLDIEKIKAGLSDVEIRSVFKPTEKAIKDLKRKDLLTEEFKTINTVRQLRVTTLKEIASA